MVSYVVGDFRTRYLLEWYLIDWDLLVWDLKVRDLLSCNPPLYYLEISIFDKGT